MTSAIWDAATQQPHGGQEWRFLQNYVADFSVTTNPLGTPQPALQAAAAALKDVHHYPAADFEPAKTALAKFLCGDQWEAVHSRLLLGNGASEIIDLLTRVAPEGGFKPGSAINQYKEYERASEALNRKILKYDSSDKAAITAIINPNNPTGEWKELEELKKFINERCEDNSLVMVDESMQPWIGHDWRNRGLLNAFEFIQQMHEQRNISIYLIHSWTKLWACPGLRIGSVICPTTDICTKIKKLQVPWSVNSMALAFVEAAVQDTDYMNQTLEVTSQWRKRQTDFIQEHFPAWKIKGEPWLSWIWCELPDEETQRRVVQVCKEKGTPIRSGAPGYNMPTHLRFGIRPPQHQDVLFAALKSLL